MPSVSYIIRFRFILPWGKRVWLDTSLTYTPPQKKFEIILLFFLTFWFRNCHHGISNICSTLQLRWLNQLLAEVGLILYLLTTSNKDRDELHTVCPIRGVASFKAFFLHSEGNFLTCLVILCKKGLLTQHVTHKQYFGQKVYLMDELFKTILKISQSISI